MQGIKLSAFINYAHCADPEGGHGVMILHLPDGSQPKIASIEDQKDFKFYLNQFKKAETTLLDGLLITT
jgi:hypothetical protein